MENLLRISRLIIKRAEDSLYSSTVKETAKVQAAPSPKDVTDTTKSKTISDSPRYGPAYYRVENPIDRLIPGGISAN